MASDPYCCKDRFALRMQVRTMYCESVPYIVSESIFGRLQCMCRDFVWFSCRAFWSARKTNEQIEASIDVRFSGVISKNVVGVYTKPVFSQFNKLKRCSKIMSSFKIHGVAVNVKTFAKIADKGNNYGFLETIAKISLQVTIRQMPQQRIPWTIR